MRFRTKLMIAAKQVSPLGLLSIIRRTPAYRWGIRGDFSSWQDVCRLAGAGYLDPRIAAHLLPSYTALFERLRRNPDLATDRTLRLLGAALVALRGIGDREAHILDFGGALGGHYFQIRPLLPASIKVRWTVCETEPMCETGSKHFANDELSFVSSLAAVNGSAALVLASGTLQYVERPYETFRALARRAPFVLVDRLPLTIGDRDRLTIHTVPPWQLRVIYPTWFLSADRWQGEVDGRAVISWECDERYRLGRELVPLRGSLLRTQQ